MMQLPLGAVLSEDCRNSSWGDPLAHGMSEQLPFSTMTRHFAIDVPVPETS
jgi:hypothetical protein